MSARTPMTATARRLIAALLLTIGSVAVPSGGVSPAAAAGSRCEPGDGVTVVVDYASLGGGVDFGCDSDGAGKPASQVVPDAGFPLSYVTNEPGFVCSVKDKPNPDTSCQRTPPSDAYWALFWSDGSTTKWNYASSGVGGLEVPDGGSIGWRFQGSGTRQVPSQPPTRDGGQTPAAKPKPSPAEAEGSGSGTAGATGSASSPTPQPRSSATRSASASASASADRSRGPAAAAKATGKDKSTKEDKGKDRKREPGKGAADRDRASEGSSVTDSAAEPVEQVEPLSATGDDGGSAGGLLPLVVGGLVALGLGGYAAVAARRRRI